MVKVRIPTPLRPLTGGQGEVETHASDILSMIDSLNGQFPGLKSRICDDTGEIRRFGSRSSSMENTTARPW